MKKVHISASSIIMSIIELVVGILLLINPVGFTTGIIMTLGIILTVMGFGKICGYFGTSSYEAVDSSNLAKGVLSVLFGMFCVFKHNWLIATFPVMTILYGVLILIGGVYKLQKAVDMLRVRQRYWYIALIGAILTLIFAVLILTNPFVSTTVLWMFIGTSLIVEAVMDVVTYIFAKRA